jgi:hypothetical protein
MTSSKALAKGQTAKGKTNNLLKKVTPQTVKTPRTPKPLPDEQNKDSNYSPPKTRERESLTAASPNDRPKTKQKATPDTDQAQTKEMDTSPERSLVPSLEETVIKTRTSTSSAFDDTFKKLAKHDQIKGFSTYRLATNRLSTAIYSLNSWKGYQSGSTESQKASTTPAIWQELFTRVYKSPKLPSLTLKESESLKILSIELAKTNPSILLDTRPHPSHPQEDVLLVSHTPHNAMFMGAGALWGHIWHLFPNVSTQPTSYTIKSNLKSPANPYIRAKPTTPGPKDAPLPGKRSYGELYMTKPCLPYEPDFQTREKRQSEICQRLLLGFMSGLNKNDKQAVLLPIKSSTTPPVRLTQKISQGASTRTVQNYLRGFQIGIQGYEEMLHMRFLIAHAEEAEDLIASIGPYMEQARFTDITIRRSPIQDEHTIPAGWLMGSITKSINLEYLTSQIQAKLPPDCKLEWLLENRELRHTHESGEPQIGLKKKKSALSITATYIMTKESHSRELTELLLNEIYPVTMSSREAPGHMALRFVPDVTLPMNAANQTMQKVHTRMAARHLSIALPQNFKTHSTTSIIQLNRLVPGRTYTLRAFILSLYHPRCRKKRIFLQVDHWATDPTKVTFTFHTSDEALAYEAIDALPLILKEQGVRQYGDLFIPGTKQDMLARYATDENGQYVPKRQKRFKELEQALEANEEYDEVQEEYLAALLEEQNAKEDEEEGNVISGMELVMQGDNAYNANEEASISSRPSLGTLQPRSLHSNSESTPPTKNTGDDRYNQELSSSNSETTAFSTNTVATLQAVQPHYETEDAKPAARDSYTNTDQKMQESEQGQGYSFRNQEDSTIQIDEDESEESSDDDLREGLSTRALLKQVANMTYKGPEDTWPTQQSAFKSQQLLDNPDHLRGFLDRWMAHIAFPDEDEPIAKYDDMERLVKKLIQHRISTTTLPLESVIDYLSAKENTFQTLQQEFDSQDHDYPGTTGLPNSKASGDL